MNKFGEDEYVFKIIIAGDSGVGKIAAVSRFVDGHFTYDTKATIGVDFSLKYVKLKSENYTSKESEIQGALQLWDVAGES